MRPRVGVVPGIVRPPRRHWEVVVRSATSIALLVLLAAIVVAAVVQLTRAAAL
jgi:hypothetical protein